MWIIEEIGASQDFAPNQATQTATIAEVYVTAMLLERTSESNLLRDITVTSMLK